jgi:hypothetical protein
MSITRTVPAVLYSMISIEIVFDSCIRSAERHYARMRMKGLVFTVHVIVPYSSVDAFQYGTVQYSAVRNLDNLVKLSDDSGYVPTGSTCTPVVTITTAVQCSTVQ